MINSLATYGLRNVEEYACYSDVKELYSILYYKSWRLLAGNEGTVQVDFRVDNKFSLTDDTSVAQGGWKVIKQKYVVLTFHDEIFYCYPAYYDCVLLILKVYGEKQYVVLWTASVGLANEKVDARSIEAYLDGSKGKLVASGYHEVTVLAEELASNEVAKKMQKGEDPTFVGSQNKVLSWLEAHCVAIAVVFWIVIFLMVYWAD